MTGVSVTPYMMEAGEERIVADRLHALLSKPPVTRLRRHRRRQPPISRVNGT